MVRKRFDIKRQVDVPVDNSGKPLKSPGGFIRAAQDLSGSGAENDFGTRFKHTGAAARERFRALLTNAVNNASGLSGRDRNAALDKPLDMGQIVPYTINPDSIKLGEAFRWSDRSEGGNFDLNKKIIESLPSHVADLASSNHYGTEAAKNTESKNGRMVHTAEGQRLLAVQAGQHHLEINRLTDLVNKNDPTTVLEHAGRIGVKLLADSTSIYRDGPSHRLRVYISPNISATPGEPKVFTNNVQTPITGKSDVDNLPKTARYKKKKK